MNRKPPYPSQNSGHWQIQGFLIVHFPFSGDIYQECNVLVAGCHKRKHKKQSSCLGGTPCWTQQTVVQNKLQQVGWLFLCFRHMHLKKKQNYSSLEGKNLQTTMLSPCHCSESCLKIVPDMIFCESTAGSHVWIHGRFTCIPCHVEGQVISRLLKDAHLAIFSQSESVWTEILVKVFQYQTYTIYVIYRVMEGNLTPLKIDILNLKLIQLKRKIIWTKPLFFRFKIQNVNFPGCRFWSCP